MTCGSQPPCRGGRTLEVVSGDFARDTKGCKRGGLPIKGGLRSPGQWPCLCPPLMPCEPPDGVPQRRLALAVVGGARPRGDRYLSAIVRLQGFLSCSPAAFPHQWSVWWGKASRDAASAPPSASRIFVILAEAEGELSRGLPLRGPVTLFCPSVWGRKASSSPAEASSSHAREGELLLPGQGVAFRPSSGRRSCRARDGHVQVYLAPSGTPEGCTARRTPRGQCSCSGVASVRVGVRTCRCALGRPLFAGVVSVDRWTPPSVLWWQQPEKVSPLMRPSAPAALRASSSSALMAGSRPPVRGYEREPSIGGVRPGAIAAVAEVAGELPGARHPAGPWYGGCSYPRERNRSPVCNGTLSTSVCSLWLSRPEHLGIRERSCVPSLFRALGLVCWLAEPLNRASVAFRGW
jgi:hypothetical protein